LPIADDLRAEVEATLAAYLRHVTERDLASLRVLREMNQPYDTGSSV
jgi:hypothetical protein